MHQNPATEAMTSAKYQAIGGLGSGSSETWQARDECNKPPKKNADLRLASAIVEGASSCPEAFSGFGGEEEAAASGEASRQCAGRALDRHSYEAQWVRVP